MLRLNYNLTIDYMNKRIITKYTKDNAAAQNTAAKTAIIFFFIAAILSGFCN